MGSSVSEALICTSRRRHLSRAGLLALALLLALLIAGAPAHALIHRGHSFAGAFGETLGAAEGSLSNPSAIAVNEANGQVYVLDSSNNRVVVFAPAPSHAFIEMWGYGVSDGAASLERCTSKCHPGIAGFAAGQFDEPVAIAVDNASGSPSRGDVYVAANRSAKQAVVDKFSPSGTLLAKLPASKAEKEQEEGIAAEGLVGVATDHSGNVWVERAAGEFQFLLERFSGEEKNRLIGTPAALEVGAPNGTQPARPGFAIDSQGNIYVTYEPLGKDAEELALEEEEIDEREKERALNKEPPKPEQVQQPCAAHRCEVAKLALSEASGELAASTLTQDEAPEGSNTTGVAVNPSSADDVFFDNRTSVAALTSAGALIQQFGTPQLQGGSGLTVLASSGEVLVADASAGRIEVFVPSPPGPPTFRPGSVAAADVTSTAASLRAAIDPNGADTRYSFEYSTGSCSSSQCTTRVPAVAGDAGPGFGDQAVSAPVAGLTPSTTYHFRVVAENQFAPGQAAVISEEGSFLTVPSDLGAALPDERGWELVSPAIKNGGAVEAIGGIGGGVVQSSSDGKGITYLTSAPVGENQPEGNRSPERSQILSTRAAPGRWPTQDIVTPNSGQSQGVKDGTPREYQAFSLDLSEAIVLPTSEAPLSPLASEQTFYLRHNATCATDPKSEVVP